VLFSWTASSYSKLFQYKKGGDSEELKNHQRRPCWARPINPFLKSCLNILWDCPFNVLPNALPNSQITLTYSPIPTTSALHSATHFLIYSLYSSLALQLYDFIILHSYFANYIFTFPQTLIRWQQLNFFFERAIIRWNEE
jgi:hypothetical protein